MLSHDQNRRATEIGPGTPCGDLLRRYWQPAALVEELAPEQVGDRPVKAITLCGEDLVLFRSDDGTYGLVERHCPHRGADLKFGRCEDNGLRCPFHGWLFAPDGRCLEQPAEPADSNFHTKVRLTSYPCRAVNGIVFAYLGPGDPPPMPACDALTAPDAYSFAFKGYLECNWLQAVEVGIDPAHASFLHRFLSDAKRDYGEQFTDTPEGSEQTVVELMRNFDRPEIDSEETDYGLRIYARRALGPDQVNVRVTNVLFPNAIIIPMARDMIISQWHVPIDDTHSWWYAIFTAFETEVDKQTMREQRLQLYTLPDYKPRQNKSNDYGFDAAEQRNETYTGMGHDINVHDQWAVESMGPIQDRTREHLGTTDKVIIAYRKLLFSAIDGAAAGHNDLPGRGRSDGSFEVIPRGVDAVVAEEAWQNAWQIAESRRRIASPWADPL